MRQMRSPRVAYPSSKPDQRTAAIPVQDVVARLPELKPTRIVAAEGGDIGESAAHLLIRGGSEPESGWRTSSLATDAAGGHFLSTLPQSSRAAFGKSIARQ